MSHLLKSKSSVSLQSFTKWKTGRGRALSEPKEISLLNKNCDNLGSSEQSLLLYPVRYGMHSIEEELLRSGYSPNIADSKGRFPIHQAVANSDIRMIQLLVEYGADLYTKNVHGQSPMIQAVYQDDVTVVKTLHEAGVSLQEQDITGSSLFDIALRESRENVCLYLIENNCETKVVNKYRELHLKTSERSSGVSLVKIFRNVFKADKLHHKQRLDRGIAPKHASKLTKIKQTDCDRKLHIENPLKGKLFHRKKIPTKSPMDIEIEIPNFKLLEISR